MKKGKLKSRRRDNDSAFHRQMESLVTPQEQQMESFATPVPTTRKNANQTHNQQLDYDEEEEMIMDMSPEKVKQNNADTISVYVNGLIAKNKINAKNAFDIPLIQLDQTHDYHRMTGDYSWRKISSSLESNNKIYGYRVDAAHNHTIKVLNMISHSDPNNQEEAHQNPGRKRYTQLSLNTQFFAQNTDEVYTKCLEKNHGNININHLETFFSVNPIMEKTKRSFDQQGMKALLLDNLVLEKDLELKITADKNAEFKEYSNSEENMEETAVVEGGAWLSVLDTITELCAFYQLIEPSEIKKEEDFDQFEAIWSEYEERAKGVPSKVQTCETKIDKINVTTNETNLPIDVEENNINEEEVANNEQEMTQQVSPEMKQQEKGSQQAQGQAKEEIVASTPETEQNHLLEANAPSYFNEQVIPEQSPSKNQKIIREVPITSEIKFKSIKFPPNRPDLKQVEVQEEHRQDKQSAYEKWTNPHPKPKRNHSTVVRQPTPIEINFSLLSKKQKFNPRKDKYDTLLIDKRYKKQIKILLKTIQESYTESNCINQLSVLKSDFLISTQMGDTLSSMPAVGNSQNISQTTRNRCIDLTSSIFEQTQGDNNYMKTNIKIAKKKLRKYIFQDKLDDFLSLYELYLIDEGYISPALCFLTLLHLANEHHLQLVQTNSSNFQINTTTAVQ